MINIDRIKPTTASTIIVCICSFFCVELMIFLLNRSLFMSLDIARLITIGIGITSPLLILNGGLVSGSESLKIDNTTGKPYDKEENETLVWSIAGLITILLLSFVTLISFTYRFSLYRAIWIIFYSELFFYIIRIFSRASQDNQNKKET